MSSEHILRLAASGLFVSSLGCQVQGSGGAGSFIVLVAVLVVMAFGVRALVRWDADQTRQRKALLRTGRVVSGTLRSFEVVASSPRGRIPTSGVRLRVDVNGAVYTLREQMPMSDVGRLRDGMAIHLRMADEDVSRAVVDWRRTLH